LKDVKCGLYPNQLFVLRKGLFYKNCFFLVDPPPPPAAAAAAAAANVYTMCDLMRLTLELELTLS
jgi:hypothetical protein